MRTAPTTDCVLHLRKADKEKLVVVEIDAGKGVFFLARGPQPRLVCLQCGPNRLVSACVCVCACVRACVRACGRASVCACVRGGVKNFGN